MSGRNGTKNLKPMNMRTKEEQKEIAKKGGKKSGEVRRKKRDAKTAALMLLNLPPTAKAQKNLKKLGLDEADFTNQMAIMARLIQDAQKGDVQSTRLLMTIAEELPEQKLAKERYEREKKLRQEDEKSLLNELDKALELIPNGL